MHTEPLRERRRAETRALIADTAAALFAERGYDAVTVEEVAHAAGVSRKTVFNHFPSKEDLVFDRAEEISERTIRAVRERAPGESPVEALRTVTREFYRQIAQRRSGGDYPIRGTIAHLVASSPALQVRALEIAGRQMDALAAALNEEPGRDELEAALAAHMLVGTQALVFKRWAHAVVAGASPQDAARTVLADADRAYDVVARGLGAR